MSSARRAYRLLAACAGAYVLLSYFWPRTRSAREQCAQKYTCTVITLENSTQTPRECARFLATRFQEEDFALVSASAQAKLRDVELQEHAQDLSNNISVSIFRNHMRVWQRVAAADTPALVLEDDAVLPADLCTTINSFLSRLQADNVSNYIVKLHELSPFYIYTQWEQAFPVDDYSVRSCRCRPHGTSSSTAAYVLDRHAAQTLLNSALPLQTHVDVFVHNMGCVERSTNLYSVLPSPVKTSSRASTHMPSLMLQRLKLLVKGEIATWMAGECPW